VKNNQFNEQEWNERLVADRRQFHRHPELGLDCLTTSARVRERLTGMGLSPRDGGGKTGVICDLKFGSGGAAVLLRADMDALPLGETGEPARHGGYVSANAGVMHACGHDGHTAMLLGAAELLLSAPPESGLVRLMFQPGEEGPGGAGPMIAAGALEGIQSAFGLHLWNQLETGRLGVRPGPAMAACDEFEITITGPGGHGAHPSETQDPILTAAGIVHALHSIVSRNVAPDDSAVVTVGAIHGGTAFNIIPSEVKLLGTVRTFSPLVRGRIEKRVTEIAHTGAAMHSLTATVRYEKGYPALINHAGIVAAARDCAAKVQGITECLTPAAEMGAEDFALVAEKVPSAFLFVGCKGGATAGAGPHHSPTFDIDEAALPVGARLYAELARMQLRANAS
jgi:amidohydrolase